MTITVEDESTWEILEATATRLRRSKPKNPQNIQTKTHKIPKLIHKKTQIFQHRSNQNSQTTATPPPRRSTKDKERLEKGTRKPYGEKRKKSSGTKRDLERPDIERVKQALPPFNIDHRNPSSLLLGSWSSISSSNMSQRKRGERLDETDEKKSRVLELN